MSEPQEVYDKLAEKYHHVGDDHFTDLLHMIMTPEEGELVLALSEPASPAELSEKTGWDMEELSAKMDSLARRGILFRGKEQYVAWGDSHQLGARMMFSSDENIPEGMLDLRLEDRRHIDNPFAEIHSLLALYKAMGKPLVRVIPARKAIESNPDIKPEDILWAEDIVELMNRADKIGVVDCDCKRIYDRCKIEDKWICIHTGEKIIDYETGRGGRMKVITPEEAVAIFDRAADEGLIHNTPINSMSVPGVICNCCTDCCSTFEPAIHAGKLYEVVAPSRFQASVNQTMCIGCQNCFNRCPIGAIEMQDIPDSKKQKARVDPNKCLGCGICVIKCKTDALKFNIIRPPEFIPPPSQMAMMPASDLR